MLKYIKLAWRNMWRNWRRTAIAMVAIVLGLILLLLMNGSIKGSDQAIFGNAVRLYGGNIQIHAPGFRAKANRMPMLPISTEEADQIIAVSLQQPLVEVATKRINTSGMTSSSEGNYPVTITAIEPDIEKDISLMAQNIAAGRFLVNEDEDAILIGQGLADLLHVNVGDRVNLLGRRKEETMRQRNMTIVGIYDLGMPEAEKGMVFISLAEAQTLYNLRDQVTEITLTLESVGQEDQLVQSLQAALPNHEVDSWDTLKPEMREIIDTKGQITSIFGLVVLMIASIGILNLMLMAVFERTREMGVLAALGMKGRAVMSLFLLEGTFIGIAGAVVGCILGWLLILYLGHVGIDFSAASQMGGDVTVLMGDHLYPIIDASDVIGSGIAVAVIAALASLYPAWQASKKEPAESLHHI